VSAAAETIPLIRHERAQAPFAFRDGRVVGAGEFLADVEHLARRLPERPCVVNLCINRYHFTVGLAAALVREQVSLLPPHYAPEFLASLQRSHPGLYALIEPDGEPVAMESTIFSEPESKQPAVWRVPQFPAGQIAVRAFTSGSTGEPLPQDKTWGSLARGAIGEAQRLGLKAGASLGLVGTVPAQHMYGLESTILIALQNALVLHGGRPFYPEDVRAALSEIAAPRMLVTTPVHLRALVDDATALPPLELILCATAPLAIDLARAAEDRFAAPVREIYGCTEAGQVASRRTIDGPQWRTLPGIKLRQDASGTYAFGGPVEREALLQDVIELKDVEHFALHGRTTDMVNIAGKRASLANLNLHLTTIAGVKDGVFFWPEETGESVTRLAAFAVAPGLTHEDIVSALRRRIDPAFIPRPLYLVDALPRSATGKLPREALLALWRRLSSKAR
jgi:acyl-coenzyme A synthetase/AMP-(fatty) acid ligase